MPPILTSEPDLSADPAARGSVAQQLLDAAPGGLLALDAERRILHVNAAARGWLGLSPSESTLAGAQHLGPDEQIRLQALLSPDSGPDSRPESDSVRLHTTAGATLTVMRRQSGAIALLTITPLAPIDPRGPNLDALTGLPDRKHFQERLTALCATAGREVALMMIDLDRFKSVNDTLGHPAGDALLKLVAQRLRGTVRNADIISRLGGDEFAIAMASGPDIHAIADRIVTVLSRPYLVERRLAVVGASVGIAFAPRHGKDPMALIRAADLALYHAKDQGRGTVRVFDDALDRRARLRTALADDLRRAIPLQQFELHFQPQLSLQDRQLSGFEALVRWRHPERGMISPQDFIPIAEETGVILHLGDWVLHEACQQAARWPDPLTVAVNVSPRQLLDRDRLPREITAALAASGLPPHRLEIEITETALVHEAEALDPLRRIRAMGVRISMDDFGTGYSSLSQLRRFPFDKLKIDRSFILGLGESDEAAAVIRAIAALGRSLGMSTIAEGVETAQQESLCRDHGCTEMQGYLTSRPVPGVEVAALIARLQQPETVP